MEDIQRAGVWKRISAFLFDLILFSVLAVLFAWGISILTGYDRQNEQLQQIYRQTESEYEVDLFISDAGYAALSEEEKDRFAAAVETLNRNGEAVRVYEQIMQLTILITSLGILFSQLTLEFAVPLLLKDGRTVGKRIFGLAVMRTEGYRINAVSLFIRTLLGKYAIGTMIPVTIGLMIYFNAIGVLGAVLILLIFVIQGALFLCTHRHTPIHDLLADTVTVDYMSQRIYENREELIRHIREEREKAAPSALG